MNWDFLAHIIRDVFPKTKTPVIVGTDHSFLPVMRSVRHSLGVHAAGPTRQPEYSNYEHTVFIWNRQHNIWLNEDGDEAPLNYFDLILMLDQRYPSFYSLLPRSIYNIVEGYLTPNGHLVVDQRLDFVFKDRLPVAKDQTFELRRFAQFSDGRVTVYENL